MSKLIVILLLVLLLNACQATATTQSTPPPVTLRNAQWSVSVNPANLEIKGQLPGAKQDVLLTAPVATEAITELKTSANQLSWRIPNKRMQVEVRLSATELSVRFTTDQEQTLRWPLTGADAQAKALLWPESEGLYLPVDDPFWLKRANDDCREAWGSALPFWGVQHSSVTMAYLLPDELRSQLCLEKNDARLVIRATHEFLKRDGFPAYEVKIVPTQHTPLGPALAYRDWLIKTGRHVTFAEKVKRAPEAAKLLGAMHAYLWGNGRTKAAMEQLAALGVKRAALFYDQDLRAHKFLVREETIAAAKAYGYVIGPYDTWSNVQDPQTAESSIAIYDEALYRTGGVMKPDGSRQKGFAGQGYDLSSEALKRASRPFITERINAHLQAGVNGYFLDVDATGGDLRDDFDPQHPMTLAQDRANRLERMRLLSEQKKLVTGSESAAAWSAPVIHFSHGSLTPKSALLWQTLRNRELIGGWWPRERPRYFFQSAEAPADFATATFDPKYRVPLYEAVFHDSLISTDFWALSLVKFKNLVQSRTLLHLLYNAPPMWHFDQQSLREDGPRLKAMSTFFVPLHERIGTAPLVRFAWLTEDRLVQQTQFGEQIVMTANFSDRAFGAIAARCIEAHWLKERRKEQFCPAP